MAATSTARSLRRLWQVWEFIVSVFKGAGKAHVIRGAGAGATGPVEDLTEPGTDVILKAGDAIFYETDVVHTARGAGDTEAVVLGSLVLKTGAPLLMAADMKMGEPTK